MASEKIVRPLPKHPKILVCPLDWGIGHATRVVPVVRALIRQGAEVHLGASGASRAFLEEEFPDLTMHEFPGYRVTYPSSRRGMARKILAQLPALLRSVRAEHAELDRMITGHRFDGVVSDNRYGLYSKRIPSIFITHQVFVQAPGRLRFLQRPIDRMIRQYTGRFEACWIPDIAGGNNLSGDLSHREPLPSRFHFIGPLSRFATPSATTGNHETGDGPAELLAILSGPEPQRTILERKLAGELTRLRLPAILVLGKPGATSPAPDIGSCKVYNHLPTRELGMLMAKADLILCRPGYSTLMDLAALGKKAILVPTPGQTEQEYLARYHGEKGNYLVLAQETLNLEGITDAALRHPGLSFSSDGKALQEQVSHFLGLIK